MRCKLIILPIIAFFTWRWQWICRYDATRVKSELNKRLLIYWSWFLIKYLSSNHMITILINLSASPPTESTESNDNNGGLRCSFLLLLLMLSISSNSSNRLLSIHEAWKVNNGSSVLPPATFLSLCLSSVSSFFKSDKSESRGEWHRFFLFDSCSEPDCVPSLWRYYFQRSRICPKLKNTMKLKNDSLSTCLILVLKFL